MRGYKPCAGHEPCAGREPSPVVEDCPLLFRPTRRPPTPILIICDDGSEEGETIRIRKDRFVIGRLEGDLTIPYDTLMSTRHAELRQISVRDKPRRSLVDLQSANGTYVRVGRGSWSTARTP